MPQNFWMAFIGLPLIAIGGGLARFAYLGPASRYVAGEVTPTIRDTIGALGFGKAEQVCASCGHHNDADSHFCNSCGKPLGRTCPSCGAENDSGARFCDGCGAPLPA
jgi:predicted amidophosphoribosyltransferase